MKKPEVFLDKNFQVVTGIQPSTRIYKNYREMWNRYPKRHKVAYFPIHLDIELNTNCNYKCLKCFQSFDPPESMSMPFTMAKKIIDEGAKKGLCSIKFNYRGEPLLYPYLIEVISYAKKKGIIDVMFNTNGAFLDVVKSQLLVKAGLDKIIVSIDDHRDQMYAYYHNTKSDGLSIVKNNIKNLQVIKAFYHKKVPIIRIQKVDRPETNKFNEEYIELFTPYADQIALHEYLDYKCVEYKEPMPNWCCASLWQRMLILADGTITSCCGLNADFVKLGHINTHTIEELWKGEAMQKFRELHMNGESHKMIACRSCALRLHYAE